MECRAAQAPIVDAREIRKVLDFNMGMPRGNFGVMKSAVVALLVFLCHMPLLPSAHAELIRLETNTNLRGVYLLSNRRQKLITVQSIFIAGEADADGPEGLSHYLEHLMYWHANKIGNRPYHGRTGNAWVNGLITTYFNRGPRSELDDMFKFAQRLLTGPELDEKFMLDERKVVSREYDFRLSENPHRREWDKMWPVVLPDNSVARSVIGTPQSIASLTLEQARSFHRVNYHPANMILLVGGDLSKDEVTAKVEAFFGRIAAGPVNEQPWRREPPQGRVDKTVVVRDRYVAHPAVARIFVADWPGPLTKNRGRSSNQAMMDVLKGVLESALQGSLSLPLRIDGFVFSDFDVGVWTVIDERAIIFFQGRLDDEVTPESATTQLDMAISDIAREGIPQATIDRVRNRLIRSAERQADSVEYVFDEVAKNLSYGFQPELVNWYVERLRSVSKDDIDFLMRAIDKADRRVTTHFVPKEG